MAGGTCVFPAVLFVLNVCEELELENILNR